VQREKLDAWGQDSSGVAGARSGQVARLVASSLSGLAKSGELPFGFAQVKKFRPYTHLRNKRETNFMRSLFVYRVATLASAYPENRKRG